MLWLLSICVFFSFINLFKKYLSSTYATHVPYRVVHACNHSLHTTLQPTLPLAVAQASIFLGFAEHKLPHDKQVPWSRRLGNTTRKSPWQFTAPFPILVVPSLLAAFALDSPRAHPISSSLRYFCSLGKLIRFQGFKPCSKDSHISPQH